MLSIILIMPPIAASAVPPCLIVTIKVFSKFGALKERSYYEIIWLQILKTLREKRIQSESYADAMRGPHVSMLSNIILAEKKFTMFTPGLAIVLMCISS
jgi:hypothetical protein